VGNLGTNRMEDIKEKLLSQTLIGGDDKTQHNGPPSGRTEAVPRFRVDLEALLHLAQGEKRIVRCVRNKHTVTACYGFGNASSGGFGSTVEQPEGLHGRFGIWGSNSKEQSSNFRELRNVVKTVVEEAKEGYLKDGELWIFTNNSTAESCFFRGGSSSKLLHNLVLRLRQAEMTFSFTLHLIHIAGTRMIVQGTDGLSRGSFLEGVARGEDMLSFINLAQNAFERSPPLWEFVTSWIEPVLGKFKILDIEEWFQEDSNLIKKTDDIQTNYGLSCTFRRTAEGQAQAANIDSDVQNAMNRWRKIEQAKGRCPRFNMVDHYAHARDLMHITWRYSFVQ
jgi:hypothetical protein